MVSTTGTAQEVASDFHSFWDSLRHSLLQDRSLKGTKPENLGSHWAVNECNCSCSCLIIAEFINSIKSTTRNEYIYRGSKLDFGFLENP